MTNTSNLRPFAAISTATLISVVKRDKYARFGKQFSDALETELQARARNPRVS